VSNERDPVKADIQIPSTERDSLKDEAVVFLFIFATVGLLLWALVKPYSQKWLVVSASRLHRSVHTLCPSILTPRDIMADFYDRPLRKEELMLWSLLKKKQVVALHRKATGIVSMHLTYLVL
jgi:hypothetical protein